MERHPQHFPELVVSYIQLAQESVPILPPIDFRKGNFRVAIKNETETATYNIPVCTMERS